MGGSLGGAPFTPASISPSIWVKADAGTWQERTIPTTAASADNDPVGTWIDQSGNGNKFVALADAKRALLKTNVQNGLPGILGDKIDDESIAGSFSVGTGDFYFMFAVKMNSSISYCGFECIGTSSNAASFEVTSKTNARWNSTNFTSSTFAVNTAYVLEVFRESGVVKLIRNGVQNATTIADANNYGTAKSINIGAIS